METSCGRVRGKTLWVEVYTITEQAGEVGGVMEGEEGSWTRGDIDGSYS